MSITITSDYIKLSALVEEQVDLIHETGWFDEEKTKSVASRINFFQFYKIKDTFLDQVQTYSRVKFLSFLNSIDELDDKEFKVVSEKKLHDIINGIEGFSHYVIDNLKSFDL